MGDRPLLSLRELSAWYTADRPVLDGLSLDLAPGEVVGLIGLNGAGKTTFLKALSGLLPGCRAGSALWKGRPLSFRAESFKRERFVAFAEDRAFPYFTFREYLSYAAAAYGRPTPDVQALVAAFGFEPCTDVLLRELSTGNRKKAALITAFALQPELLLLDEPVNGLDFQSTETLYRLMAGYRPRGTLLFSSHILESICLTADRVLVLEQGRIRRTFAGAQITAEAIREVLRDDAAVQSDR